MRRVLLTVAALALTACASRGAWLSFSLPGVLLDKAPIMVPSRVPGFQPQRTYVLFIAIGEKVISGEVPSDLFLALNAGDCIQVRGEKRGERVRNVVLSVPCEKKPTEKGTTASRRERGPEGGISQGDPAP